MMVNNHTSPVILTKLVNASDLGIYHSGRFISLRRALCGARKEEDRKTHRTLEGSGVPVRQLLHPVEHATLTLEIVRASTAPRAGLTYPASKSGGGAIKIPQGEELESRAAQSALIFKKGTLCDRLTRKQGLLLVETSWRQCSQTSAWWSVDGMPACRRSQIWHPSDCRRFCRP